MGKGRVAWTTPLVFQSKLLCLSLLYLATTLSLCLYASFSQQGCVFQLPSRRDSDGGRPLFSYPSTYGERKHALPASRACGSPVLFPEYQAAYDEIHRLCRSPPPLNSSSALRYMTGIANSFSGNFSAQKRKSYFDHERSGDVEVPCGFLKEFPLTESDRSAMEECRGVVVASAIFGDYDKVRQPKGLGAPTLRTACFFLFIDDSTLRALNANNILLSDRGRTGGGGITIGAWRVVVVPTAEVPYENPAMNGVIAKHLLHRLFPNSKFSVWVDAKLQLTVDPLLLIHSLLVSKDADMAISKHPFNVHTMEEAVATARWRKWGDVEGLRVQMENYCENGLQPWSPSKLPYTTDVPDTALILRRHSLRSNLFSCLLFNELEAFNPRDQLAFAYVRDLSTPKIRIHMFEVETFEQIAVEYRHNLKSMANSPELMKSTKTVRRASSRGINGSSCEHYLLKMWGEIQ